MKRVVPDDYYISEMAIKADVFKMYYYLKHTVIPLHRYPWITDFLVIHDIETKEKMVELNNKINII